MAYVITGDAATNRANLGLGTAATLDVGSGANNIVQLDGSGNLPALDGSALTGVDAGAVELIATTNLYSDSTIVNVDTSNFDNSFSHHRVVYEFVHVSPTSGGNAFMRFSENNNASTAGAVHSYTFYWHHSGWAANSYGTTSGRAANDVQIDADGSANTTQVYVVDLWGMNKAKEKVFSFYTIGKNHDANNINGARGIGGFFSTASSNCAISFQNTSAYFGAGGVVKVYGVS